MKTVVPFIDLKSQYETLKSEIWDSWQKILENTDFILGEEVKKFEEEFSEYLDIERGIGVASGTDAIHLALRAMGIGENAEVILQANTFIATAFAVSQAGAVPVFVDVNPETLQIEPDRVKEAISPRTKAIIPVHLFGMTAPVQEILNIADHYGLSVIEDACQSHGAEMNGKKAGSFAQLAAFSFYPGKNLGAYGDAGFVAVNDGELGKRIEMLRNYGQAEKFNHLHKGFNSRLDTLQAAVLRIKLRRLEEWNVNRRKVADYYRERLKNTNVKLTKVPENCTPVYHLYIVRVSSRDKIREGLNASGIQTGLHYPCPIHLQPCYSELGYKKGDFPVAEEAAEQMISLPVFPEMTEEQVDYTTSKLLELISETA